MTRLRTYAHHRMLQARRRVSFLKIRGEASYLPTSHKQQTKLTTQETAKENTPC